MQSGSRLSTVSQLGSRAKRIRKPRRQEARKPGTCLARGGAACWHLSHRQQRIVMHDSGGNLRPAGAFGRSPSVPQPTETNPPSPSNSRRRAQTPRTTAIKKSVVASHGVSECARPRAQRTREPRGFQKAKLVGAGEVAAPGNGGTPPLRKADFSLEPTASHFLGSALSGRRRKHRRT